MNEQELRTFLNQYVAILNEEEKYQKLYEMYVRCKTAITTNDGNLSIDGVLEIFEGVNQGFKIYVKGREDSESHKSRASEASCIGGRPMASCMSDNRATECSSGVNRRSCDASASKYDRSYQSNCDGIRYGRC